MASSRRSWQRLARRLEGRFRIFAYDQRGHGDSSSIHGPMALARGVRDAENVISAIGEPVDVLLGHSWGGAVAILAGEDSRVARVAAIDPMLRQVPREWYAEFLAELSEVFELSGDARDARTRSDYDDWVPLDVEGKVHAVHSMAVTPIENLWRENPRWDLRPLVARYGKPLLLAMAQPGEGINEEGTLEAVERNYAPNVRIVSFPGAGHNLHRTAFDAFAGALDEWINATLTPS